MKFWWVNHKQTHDQEIEGGYIWSPKKNKNGSQNQTYDNLPRTSVNDFVFSYASGEIKAIGVVKQKCEDSERPAAFGHTGDQWNYEGHLVYIDWTYLDIPINPKDYITQIAPLLPAKYSPIREDGNGNQNVYLAEIGSDLGSLILKIADSEDATINAELNDLANNILDDKEEESIKGGKISPTDKTQLIKARRGQGIFRLRLERIEQSCRLTGVSDRRFLVASHIKPWRISNSEEKLDGNNGLLLAPHVDQLFDRGWISFSSDGDIICTNKTTESIMEQWHLNAKKNVGGFNEIQQEYLAYHRKNILKV